MTVSVVAFLISIVQLFDEFPLLDCVSVHVSVLLKSSQVANDDPVGESPESTVSRAS